jgi:NADPH:quinone reductase-like Zn-dependent oxidoreductase
MNSTMKANRVHEFGGPEVIVFEDIAVPVPAPGELLLRVQASGVGPWDAWVRAGRSALPQPLPLTLGSDVAGTVEAIGSVASRFKPGDAVYGVTNAQFTGGYAEFVLVKEGMIALKPRTLGNIAAASIPVIAVTARQMLFGHARVVAGQRVLVHGAAGNVGAYAVRMAHAAGAHVLAMVRPREAPLAEALGAGEIIDLPSSPDAAHRGTIDAVIDTIGGPAQRLLFDYLRPGGVLVSAVTAPDEALTKQYKVRGIFFLVSVTTEELEILAEDFDANRLAVRIGEVLHLNAARQAHEMLEGLLPKRPGKIVLSGYGAMR